MDTMIKQISSMEKIRSISDIQNCSEINNVTLLGGETFSYQQVMWINEYSNLNVKIESELKEYIKLYELKNAVMDLPDTTYFFTDDDYITKEPGLMPDILVPIEEQNFIIRRNLRTVWVEVRIPNDFPAGNYNISVSYDYEDDKAKIHLKKNIAVEVMGVNLPKQNLKMTQWFHADCIADVHSVEIYSEAHWKLIGQYMKTAFEHGINLIYTPLLSPALDTNPGLTRPNTQLVKIFKSDGKYSFDFSLLKRWIDLARLIGIHQFEISHLFSQSGGKFSPNIWVTEDSVEKHMFGWHVLARDASYQEFLQQMLPELVNFLKLEGIYENTYFHLIDEPGLEHMDDYRYACDLVKPLIGDAKIMDALSNVDFYESGLVEIPVTASNHIEPFLKKNIENQWVYYACNAGEKVSNRFIAMPTYRNRIIGLQLYKYDIKGFLHWGFNFYYSHRSLYKINPYMTTSGDKYWPSGDAFSVYPGKEGPLTSLRLKVFMEALQDICLCKLLESFIGKKKVVDIIENVANGELTFFEYPRTSDFLPEINKILKEEIRKYV